MNNILCIQISTNLINGKPDLNDIATRYYKKLYKVKKQDGYLKGYHFWECPQWITEINHNVKTDLYICKGIEETVNYILNHKHKYICFSVLEVNKHIIKAIINLLSSTDKIFILGGYIDFNKFRFNNAIDFKTIKQFIEFLGVGYKQGFNYDLFKGLSVIPRLSLSTGCLHNCDFCTIEKQIKKMPTQVIEQQINAFKPLKFKLVYINDKTFGQCSNYQLLNRIYKAIKEYNPGFKGFIIQTTTTQFNKLTEGFLYKSHINYVELGIESFNDDILKLYHKPSTQRTTITACLKIKAFNKTYEGFRQIKLIANILCGIPEETPETYFNTYHFINYHSDIISHLNIYNLAVYDNTPLAKRLKHTKGDNNENSLSRSYLKDGFHKIFYDEIHKLSIDILGSD